VVADAASVRQAIGSLVVTPRPLAEYRDMFRLTEADLRAGPILDCPGGASPFGTQVRARGGSVTSVDPAFRMSAENLARSVHQDIEHAAAWMRDHPDNFDWSYMGSPAAFTRSFQLAAEMFLMDYAPDDVRYVAASLPRLPFEDRAFALSLCSHLLFCYPEYLGYAEHVTSLLELTRVTRHEVRVYPLVDTAGNRYARMSELRSELAGHGVATEVRRANCQYVLGSDRMLVCRRGE